jgi:hypothetical protein
MYVCNYRAVSDRESSSNSPGQRGAGNTMSMTDRRLMSQAAPGSLGGDGDVTEAQYQVLALLAAR